MSKEERDKITEFVASMGFEASSDLMSLTASIEDVIEIRRAFVMRREQKLRQEWAPGGWRREGEAVRE